MLAASALSLAGFAQAGEIGIFEFTTFLAVDGGFGDHTRHITDDPVFFPLEDFLPAGLDISFTNSLDANNEGTLGVEIVNNTGGDLANVHFFGYLDGDVDGSTTTFFNEFGARDGDDAAFTGSADFWEIDEPGLGGIFGDIFLNLLDGFTDQFNAVSGIEDDVAMALGFDLGSLAAGARIVSSFFISANDNGGLQQSDADTGESLYFNAQASIQGVSVPEAGSGMLLLAGLGAALAARRRRLALAANG